MNDEKQVLKLAAERLLAVANGATLEWANGTHVLDVLACGVHTIGGGLVRIRPPAVAPEPKPSQAVLDACRRLGVEAWKLAKFELGDEILAPGAVYRDGDSYASHIGWHRVMKCTVDQGHHSRGRLYWHVRPIAATLPCPPKPSQEWMDRHDVELTGEYRTPNVGELIHWTCGQGNVLETMPAEPANAGANHGPRWILRKRASLPCPPRPTPEQVAAARMPDGRRVKEPAVCEVPNGRAWFSILDCALMSASLEPVDDDKCGMRRWIAEPADEVVEPWTRETCPVGSVVVDTDGARCQIAEACDEVMKYGGHRQCTYDWALHNLKTDNGQPCGVAK